MKFFTWICLFLILISAAGNAQDPHFSQFYYSPLTLNPALTGNMDGTYRVGLNYRNQWASITSPYVYSTASGWADFSLYRGKFNGNSLAMGIMVLDDMQGSSPLGTTDLKLSLAYHQSLDVGGNYHISAGLQGGMMQRRVDMSKFNFYNQFNGSGFDNNLPSGENFDPSYWRSDFAAGIAFNGLINNHSRVSLGTSVFHLTTPNESFKEDLFDLYLHYIIHADATFGINNTIYLFPAIYYQAQGPNSELVGGTAIGYNFSPNKRKVGTIYYIGGFYRLNDAAIATTGFIAKGFQVGISYDVNISNLEVASSNQGGFEVALKYGNIIQQKKMKKTYCPRF